MFSKDKTSRNVAIMNTHYLDDKHTATINTASIVGLSPDLKVYRKKKLKWKMRDSLYTK